MKAGQEVLIEGLGASGDGVGRLQDGRVVFVQGALPGDRVTVSTAEQRKKVQYANLLELVEPSGERVVSRCTVERCGGCPLRSYSAAGQGEAKRARLVETLRRLGQVNVEDLLGPVRQFGDGWAYRHRVRLHAQWTGKGYTVGYHARRTRSVIGFTSCPVLLPELEKVAAAVSQGLAALPRHARLQEVEIAYSQLDQRAVMKLTGAGPITPYRRLAARLEELGVSGVDVETPDARWRHGNVELRYDHARASEFDLRFEAGVFTQAHPAANDRLVEGVLTAVRPRETPSVLELHAGIGNFSLPLARAGAQVVAVEQNQRASILARRNARRAGLTLHCFGIRDEDALEGVEVKGELRLPRDFNVLLLDPPRTGAAAVCKAVAQEGPRRVVYVSCDPATLARDVATLGQGGYQVAHIEAYDMFPQTAHVEALVVLDRPETP